MPKVKAVVFDFDGTIAKNPEPSSWQLIEKRIGIEEEDDFLNEQFHSGKISFKEWSEESMRLYIRHGLNRDILEAVLDEVSPMKGTVETFERLKKEGIIVGIVSGGIKNFYEHLKNVYGMEADWVSFVTEITFDESGEVDEVDCNEFDYEGKVQALENFCDLFGIKPEDCAYVGDSRNDIHVFKVVKLPIAFCPKYDEVRKIAKHVIEEPDMSKVIDFVI